MESTATPPSIPSLRRQRPSVDYIDTRLPDRHEAFTNHGARYNPDLGCYAPAPILTVAVHGGPGPVVLHDSPVSDSDGPSEDSDGESPSPRRLPPEVTAMSFWSLIFDDSLKSFKSEHPAPKGRSQTTFDIRNAASWDDVYSKLQLAREAYDGTKKGFWGRVKSTNRKIADHAAGATRLAKFIPEGTYTSPVRAAVEVITDAFKAAAEIRKKTTQSFDSQTLDRVFGDVESFLSTFPKDENIEKASIELVVAIFKAIEDTIGFFIQGSFNRARSAVVRGEKYQELLLESIDQVSTYSKYLVHQAQNAHLVTTSEGLGAVQRQVKQTKKLQRQTKKAVEDGGARLLNHVQSLLDDGERTRELLLRQEARVEQLERQQDRLIRQLTPSPQIPWFPTHFPQQTSMQLLGPVPQPQLPWVVPAPVFVQAPITMPTPIHPQPFWLAQPAMQSQPAPPIDQNTLRELFSIANTDETDINHIMESRDRVPARYRNRTEQVANTEQFRDWIVSPTSRELLLSGERGMNGNGTSALSLLCATMMSSIRKRTRHLGLVFFCGQHTEEDDNYSGPNVLIRSLTSQLLRYPYFDTTLLGRDIDMDGVRSGDIRKLCAVFGWLVKQLPRSITLICLIDDISSYDNDEYEIDMLIVLESLIDLARDDQLTPAFKILATSPLSADSMQKLFKEDDSCHLSVEELPWVSHETGSVLRLQGRSDSGLEESNESESELGSDSKDDTDQSD